MPLQCSMQWMRGSFSKAKISKNDTSLINETKVEQHISSNVIAPNQTVQIKNISLSVSASQQAEWSCCIIVQISYVFVIMWYLELVCSAVSYSFTVTAMRNFVVMWVKLLSIFIQVSKMGLKEMFLNCHSTVFVGNMIFHSLYEWFA